MAQNLLALANAYLKFAESRDELSFEQVNNIKNSFKEIAAKIYDELPMVEMAINDALEEEHVCTDKAFKLSSPSGKDQFWLQFFDLDNPIATYNLTCAILDVQWKTSEDGSKVKALPRLIFKDGREPGPPKPKKKPKPEGPFPRPSFEKDDADDLEVEGPEFSEED